MKITTILFFALVTLSFASASLLGTKMCRNVEVAVSSSMQKQKQNFDFDVKKIININMGINKEDFLGQTLIPLEEVGFVLKKKKNQALDSIHHKYFRNEANSIWLPYAYCSIWERNAFVLTNQLTRTATNKKETPLVYFEFINDPSVDNLSSNDMDTFLNNLRKNTSTRIAIKEALHKKISAYQDDYLNADNQIKTTIQNNNDIKARITKLKADLTRVTTEITTLTTTETTLIKEVATNTSVLKKTTDTITELLVKITLIEKTITKITLEITNFKPTDTSQEQAQFDNYMKNVQLPQNAPQRFLEEYGISVDGTKNTVVNSYNLCDPKKPEKINDCFTTASNGTNLKKFRRSFF